jgi:hypothetical protein
MPTLQIADLYRDLKTALMSVDIEPVIVTRQRKRRYVILKYSLYEDTLKTIDSLTQYKFVKQPYKTMLTYSVSYPYQCFCQRGDP